MKAFRTQAKSFTFSTMTRRIVISSLPLFLLSGNDATHFLPTVPHPVVHARPSTVPTPSDQDEVTSLGQQFMNALLHQKYAVMWSMLHPQMQAIWPNQESFANYLQMRFANYTLQSFSLGTVNHLSSWTNPETMQEYQDVEIMPISLHSVSQLSQEQQAQLAPQFREPDALLQNLPLIVQRVNNQWLVLKGGPADPEAPILPSLNPVSKTVAVPILMYHYISDVPPNDPNPVLRQSLSVSPPLFNQQLDYLKQQGYHSVTLNQVMNALYYGVPLPSKPIVLTFDDGYLDGYTAAYPALKAHGFSGMFYIITGKVGWQGQMNWDQLRDMLANGMQMGSHTVHHVDMGLTYQASASLANQEAQVSQKNMQDQLGISIQHFCYPNGGPFKGHDTALQQAVVALLAVNGYVDATTDPGPTGVTQNSLAPFVLLRLRIDGRSSLQTFINTLAKYP